MGAALPTRENGMCLLEYIIDIHAGHEKSGVHYEVDETVMSFPVPGPRHAYVDLPSFPEGMSCETNTIGMLDVGGIYVKGEGSDDATYKM